MKICNILNEANGEKSELHQELLRVLKNQNESDLTYARVLGSDFAGVFGNWVGNYKGTSAEKTGKTYPKGEPKLFKKEKTNQYYFELADGTKEFIDKEGLRNEFSPTDIKDITKYFLYKYVTEGRLKSLNEFEATESNSSVISRIIDKAIDDYKIEISQIEDLEVVSEYLERIALVNKYKDEFRNELIFAIQSLGEEVREVAEEDKGGGVNITESITVNPKTSATINTKIFLSQIRDARLNEFPNDIAAFEYEDGTYVLEDADENVLADDILNKKEAIKKALELSDSKEFDVIGNTTGFLNTESFLSLNEVWETLRPLLSDIVTTGTGQDVKSAYSKMYAKLKEMEPVKPWIADLMEKLDELEVNNRHKLYEFVQAFSKTKVNYYVTNYNETNSEYKVINATSTNTRESQLLDSWGYKFKNEFLPNNQSKLTPGNKKRIEDIIKNIEAISSEFNQDLKNSGNSNEHISEAFTSASYKLFKELRELGIFDVEPRDINALILLNGGVENQVDTMNSLFKGIRYMINGFVLTNDRSFIDNGDAVNPFRTESILRDLAKAEGLRNVDISESSILANNNKTYYGYSNPTYVSNKISEWIEDPTQLERMANEVYNKNSGWLRFLTGSEINRKEVERKKVSKLRLDRFKAGLASSFKSVGKNDGVDNVRISFEDQLNDNIVKLLGAKIKGGKSYFPTIVAADKSRRIEFEGLPMFDSGIRGTEEDVIIHDNSIELLLSYFTDEYNRMKVVKRENAKLDDNKKVKHYHGKGKNGMRSQLFPEFDFDNNNPKYEALRISLYTEDGTPHTDDTYLGLSDSQRDLLKEATKESLQKRVLEATSEIKGLNGLDSKLKKAYGSDVALAGDYVMNGIISTVEYTKMFSGDPAFYKNLPDLIKRVPATYTDGLQLSLENNDQLRFNMAVVNKVNVASKYYDVIKKSLKDKSIADPYKEVNTTDAQAWITPRRWRFLKQRLGQWSPKHDNVFEKMMSGKEMRPDELKLAAQPMKGVYFEINNNVPTYLKYSQAVLIPSLVKGTPMEKLYDKMTMNPVTGERYIDAEGQLETHEVITIDGVKVGAVSPTSINKEGTTKMLEEFELNNVELSNKGWKLQQDLPVKTMHETNLGSQIQKNILEGLQLNKDYKLGNEKVQGSVLLQKIHDAISDLSNIGKDEVSSRLGIVDNKITSKETLYDVLIDEFKSRGGNENIISALEKETPFDAIPQIRGRVDSILMGIFNKAITKISTQGGSYIQVSPFGLETIGEFDVKNILQIKPKQSADKKAISKAKISNKFIGFADGISNSSTKLYSEQAGALSNTGDYDSKDVVFVSIPGKRGVEFVSKREQDKTIREAIKAVESGATILTDNKEYIESSDYNTGEKRLYKNLEANGYIYSETTVDGNIIGYWSKKSTKTKSKSDIKIVSKKYNGTALLPPRRGPDGQTLPGQAMIPHSLALKILTQNGYNINDIKDNEWKKLFNPKALEIISYRIPNQGMSSNDTLEIVGILPSGMGDSIIGYDGIPAKTGSDFDIDKMFVMAPNLVFNKNTKKLEALSEDNKEFFSKEDEFTLNKQLAQNNVIDLYQAILQSPHTYDNMMTSIDSSFLKKDIMKLFPAPAQENLTFFSPISQLRTKMDYMSGKMGVALTANQLVDHVSNQSLDIRLSTSLGIAGENGITLMDRDKEGIPIATALSAFLNAYVDIAKDPYVSRANHNDTTANVTFMLIRAGVGVGYLNRFIGQPILKEYVELTRRKDSITGAPLIKDGKLLDPGEFLIKEKGFKEDNKDAGKLKDISAKDLEKNLTERRPDIDAIVLNSFLKFEKDARKFSDAVLAAKSDTKGAGGSPVDLILNTNKINKVIDDKFILNYKTKFENTSLGTYKNNSLSWVQDVLNNSEILLSGTYVYEDMLNSVSARLGKGNYMISADLAKEVANGFYSYLMSGTKMFSDNRSKFKDLFTNLPKTVQTLKEEGEENFLIKELEISSRGGFDFIGINNKNKPVDYQNDIYRAWLDLYRNDDTKKIAVDLAKYAYSQSGFQPNLNQFFTYIPHEILKDKGMNSDVKGMFQRLNDNIDSDEFIEQLLRHNSDNKMIVKLLNIPEGAEINDVVAGFYGDPMSPEDMRNGLEHPLFVSMKLGEVTGLYKLIGVNNEDRPMYLRTFKMGYSAGKNKVFEYSFDNKVIKSVVNTNNFEDSPTLKGNIKKKYTKFTSEIQNFDGTNFNAFDDAKAEATVSGTQYMLELQPEFEQENSTALSLDILKKNLEQIKEDEGIQDPDCKKGK